MGFWDIFKKKEPIKIERIKFEELESWLESNKKEAKKQEGFYVQEIQDSLSKLISELEQGLVILEKVNVDEKKAEEKLKLVVKENLQHYASHLVKFKDKLKEISESNEGIIEKIDSAFLDFNRKSSPSFQKATFLIGEELGNVKEIIGNFLRDVKRITDENKPLIDKLKALSSVEKKLASLSEAKKRIHETEAKIKENNERCRIINYALEEKNKEIEKIKGTENFIAQEREKERTESIKKDIEQDISKLRESIDFKALSSFFHSFEKDMKKVKEYKDNFRQAFQKTSGQELIELLKEAKLLTEGIASEIGKINEKQHELASIKIEDTGIEKIEREIQELRSNIQSVNSSTSAEQKIIEKTNSTLNELISSIKGELIKINVEVE
jgi:hypothetical protein